MAFISEDLLKSIDSPKIMTNIPIYKYLIYRLCRVKFYTSIVYWARMFKFSDNLEENSVFSYGFRDILILIFFK